MGLPGTDVMLPMGVGRRTCAWKDVQLCGQNAADDVGDGQHYQGWGRYVDVTSSCYRQASVLTCNMTFHSAPTPTMNHQLQHYGWHLICMRNHLHVCVVTHNASHSMQFVPSSRRNFSSWVQAMMISAANKMQISAALWATIPIAAYLLAPNA